MTFTTTISEETFKLSGKMREIPLVNGIASTLEERGQKYGPFRGHAAITMALKTSMEDTIGWSRLSDSQKEALHMIAHKIGRILNGDPNYADSWHDIAGYATLIDKQLSGEDI